MAEYIDREALIEFVKQNTPNINGETTIECVERAIRTHPAADVVEVVRCKNCKYFCPYEGEEHKGDCAELVGLESCVYEDDFCSYGIRKDGNENAE